MHLIILCCRLGHTVSFWNFKPEHSLCTRIKVCLMLEKYVRREVRFMTSHFVIHSQLFTRTRHILSFVRTKFPVTFDDDRYVCRVHKLRLSSGSAREILRRTFIYFVISFSCYLHSSDLLAAPVAAHNYLSVIDWIIYVWRHHSLKTRLTGTRNANNVRVSCRWFNLCTNSTRRKFSSVQGAQFKKCGKSLRQ